MSFVTEFWYEKYEVGGRDSRKGSSKLYLRVFSPHFLTFVIMTISTFFSPFSYFLYHNTCKTTKPTIMFSVEKYNLGMNLVKYAFNISSKNFGVHYPQKVKRPLSCQSQSNSRCGAIHDMQIVEELHGEGLLCS